MSGASAAAVAHTVHVHQHAGKNTAHTGNVAAQSTKNDQAGKGRRYSRSQRVVRVDSRVRDDGGAGEANHAFLDPSLAGRDLPSDVVHTSGFPAGTVAVIHCTRPCRTHSPKAAARKGADGQKSDSDDGACRWRAVCGGFSPLGGPAKIAGKN